MMVLSGHTLNPMQPRCVSKATVQVRWNLRFVWLLTLAAQGHMGRSNRQTTVSSYKRSSMTVLYPFAITVRVGGINSTSRLGLPSPVSMTTTRLTLRVTLGNAAFPVMSVGLENGPPVALVSRVTLAPITGRLVTESTTVTV